MNARELAQWRWDHVAKPLHSLGLLEDMIVKIAGIQETADVRIERRCALVFCADHGVVAEGVSQSGSEVTALVAQSIVEGTANINLMAGFSNADVYAVDMGMLNPVPGTLDRRIAEGTANMAKQPAMTCEQAQRADKGFQTLECEKNLASADIADGSIVLLEDLVNLMANEMFDGGDVNRIVPALNVLAKKCGHLIMVTNDIFSDGIEYAESTQEYIRQLAQINNAAAQIADYVVEVVYSIPIAVKGELPCV